MKFIVGIGNPGKEYDQTRHNIGFEALETIVAGRKNAGHPVKWVEKKKLQAWVADLSDCLLIKAWTYVNRVSDATTQIKLEYNASPGDFLFVCDDLNLAFGKIRLRDSGGAGGHHGLESAIEGFGTKDFPRVRIGVGSEDMPRTDLAPFVLGKFSRDEQKALPEILDKVVKVCRVWVENGIEAAQAELGRLQSVS